MSNQTHYRDEHGAEVAYNPALRGGPGSTGEALFRTYLLETLLAISADLSKLAEAFALDPSPIVEREPQPKQEKPRAVFCQTPTVRPPEFVLCNHESVIHVGGIVHGGPCDEQS